MFLLYYVLKTMHYIYINCARGCHARCPPAHQEHHSASFPKLPMIPVCSANHTRGHSDGTADSISPKLEQGLNQIILKTMSKTSTILDLTVVDLILVGQCLSIIWIWVLNAGWCIWLSVNEDFPSLQGFWWNSCKNWILNIPGRSYCTVQSKISPFSNLLYTTRCLTKWWSSLHPRLRRTERLVDAPFTLGNDHLFTFGTFQSDVTGAFTFFCCLHLLVSDVSETCCCCTRFLWF